MSKHLTKDLALVYASVHNGWMVYHEKRQCLVKPSEELAYALNLEHKWTMHMIAMGRIPQTGEIYLRTQVVSATEPRRREQLADEYLDIHQALEDSIPEHQFIGLGSVASTSGRVFSDAELYTLMDQLEAWSPERNQTVMTQRLEAFA